MSIENVGLEKLPNVYFRKINLIDNDTESFSVSLDVLILDEHSENNFIWSTDPIMRSFLRVAIIETSSPILKSKLTSAVISPNPYSIIKDPSFDGQSKVYTFGFGDMGKVEDLDDKYFTIKTKLVKPNDTQELSLFALTYIDHKELSNFLDIKLTGALSNYSGPLTSETIISSGTIQRTSNAFIKPDALVWAGPVHQTGNKWYSGSRASKDAVELKRITVKNLKLTDTRSKITSSRTKTSFSQVSLFSNFQHSFGSNADLFGMFSINIKQFILLKTVFGKQIYDLSKDLFQQVVDSIDINSVEIRRRQVDFNRQTNRLGTPFYSPTDKTPFVTVATLKDLGETKLLNLNHVKTFDFADVGMSPQSRGEFIYEVHATLLDKTQKFVENVLDIVKTNVNSIKLNVDVMNRPRNYDYDLDELRTTTTIPSNLPSLIDDYYRFYSMLRKVSDLELNQMVEDKKSLFKMKTYTASIGKKFVNEYEKLFDSLSNKFGIFPRGQQTRKANPSIGYPPNLISISKTFEDSIRFNEALVTYEIFENKGNATILRISKDDFLSRADTEVSRFFDLSKSTTSEDILDISSEDQGALRDLDASKFSFMAPIAFNFGESSADLMSLQNVDLDELSDKFVEFNRKSREQNYSSKTHPKVAKPKTTPTPASRKRRIGRKARVGRFKFNFRPITIKINNINKDESEFRESSGYLGPNSEFINIENNFDKDVPAKDSRQVEKRFAIANELTAKRSKKSFDLTEKNNFLERFKASRNYDVEKIRKLPLSIKSIINSRSTAARNNILSAESDILKQVDTKIATEMIFHSNQKIEALIGYGKASDGTEILTKPIWGDLTPKMLIENKETLCRVVYVDLAELGLKTAPEFKLPVQNSTFIIEGDGENKSPIDIPEASSELPEIEAIAYTTSNVVRQPRR
jgi:hypothetical protein